MTDNNEPMNKEESNQDTDNLPLESANQSTSDEKVIVTESEANKESENQGIDINSVAHFTKEINNTVENSAVVTVPLDELLAKTRKTSFTIGALTGSLASIFLVAVAAAVVLSSPSEEKVVEEKPVPIAAPVSKDFQDANLAPFDVAPKGLSPAGGMYLGSFNKQAPTIELYADPQCPYCKRFHDDFGPVLKALSEAGYLNVAVKPMDFLGEDSTKAVNAWACVYENKGPKGFELVYDALYKIQDPAKSLGQYGVEKTLAALKSVGLDQAEITECVTYGKFANYSKESNKRASERGVQGTPTLIDEKGSKIEDLGEYLQKLAE